MFANQAFATLTTLVILVRLVAIETPFLNVSTHTELQSTLSQSFVPMAQDHRRTGALHLDGAPHASIGADVELVAAPCL